MHNEAPDQPPALSVGYLHPIEGTWQTTSPSGVMKSFSSFDGKHGVLSYLCRKANYDKAESEETARTSN
jgi:hypothetical protein